MFLLTSYFNDYPIYKNLYSNRFRLNLFNLSNVGVVEFRRPSTPDYSLSPKAAAASAARHTHLYISNAIMILDFALVLTATQLYVALRSLS
jgi:hypothetical protein